MIMGCRHGGDMAGAGARRAAWNVALMRDGLAPQYLQVLLELSSELGPGPELYRCGAGARPCPRPPCRAQGPARAFLPGAPAAPPLSAHLGVCLVANQ